MKAETVLLVDSYAGSRRALADLLRECGYSVLEASNGLEGLQVAREARPCLVIVDLWPFFSASVQMVERLRSDDGAPIQVLVLTSAVSTHHRDRALSAGCAGFLEKPCPADEVLAQVRRSVGPPLALAASAAGSRPPASYAASTRVADRMAGSRAPVRAVRAG